MYQDDDALRKLLALLEPMGPDEIIVVRPEKDPPAPQSSALYRDLPVSAPNRGAQLDAGARAATGELLWFLHADARPSEHALDAIRHAVADGAESGCFRFMFTGPGALWKTALEWAIAARAAAGGMVYGDQGLFALASAYKEAGGFARQRLFEEVPLIRALRSKGSFRRLSIPLGVSPRRWQRDGWLARTLHNRWLATCYMLGASADSLAKRYHGE